ncbi:MAG: response regulator [Lachnospiraceae bacterium]|nr:response regulator [Lachnospiraceae bacterium]
MDRRKRILVVDDDELNRIVLKRILVTDGYIVLEAGNGIEAIRCMEKDYVDLVLLDLIMPYMDGFRFLEEMQKTDQLDLLPVIIISADCSKENILKAYRYDVTDIISKPFEPDMILDRVKNMLKLYEYKKKKFMSKERQTILVVEDKDLNRMLLRKILADDYYIVEAVNGSDALGMVRKYRDELAVILLDIVMPVMNGMETLEHLHEMGVVDEIPVVFITMESTEENLLRGINLGIRDMISKPFEPEAVRKRVANMVELHQHLMAEKEERERLAAEGEDEDDDFSSWRREDNEPDVVVRRPGISRAAWADDTDQDAWDRDDLDRDAWDRDDTDRDAWDRDDDVRDAWDDRGGF